MESPKHVLHTEVVALVLGIPFEQLHHILQDQQQLQEDFIVGQWEIVCQARSVGKQTGIKVSHDESETDNSDVFVNHF